jgi:hypothetical protein
VLNSLIFEHIEALAPVLRDTVRYLAVTLPKAQAAKRGKQILAFCKDSDIGALPFVRMWILELLHRRPDLCSAADAIALAEESTADLGYRPAALLAAVYKQVDWVRARKETCLAARGSHSCAWWLNRATCSTPRLQSSY